MVPALLLAVAILSGCGHFLTDAATRLATELADEASALRRSKQVERTFEHRPIASPEGVSGDYCIDFVLSKPNVDGHSLILVGDHAEGPLRWSTTSHNASVHVARDFRASHPDGGPTVITLRKRGHEVWITDVR